MKYKVLAFLITVNVLFGSEQIWAQSCKSVFSGETGIVQAIPPSRQLKDLVHAFRQSKISRKKKGQVITVNDTHYVIEGSLGKGTSTAYLAFDPKGTPVVVKTILPHVEDRNWPNTVFYEIAATNFFLESGIKVPRILDYTTFENAKGDLTQSILIKEYVEGVTYEEIYWLSLFRTKNWGKYYPLNEQLQPEKQRLSRVFEGFSSWLDKNQIDLWKHPFKSLSYRIQDYDSANRNFIYNPEKQTWILFDP